MIKNENKFLTEFKVEFCMMVLCLLILIFSILNFFHHRKPTIVIKESQYCEMVSIWEKDNNPNLNHRNGWPNYKKIDCGGHSV